MDQQRAIIEFGVEMFLPQDNSRASRRTRERAVKVTAELNELMQNKVQFDEHDARDLLTFLESLTQIMRRARAAAQGRNRE